MRLRRWPRFSLLGLTVLISATPVTQFPQLLPNADNFALTIRENPSSTLTLGPSCGGEASRTLACQAFTATLKNIGARTVRLSRVRCWEPAVRFEIKQPGSSTGWWPVSVYPYSTACKPLTFENLRLRPGETAQFETRLVSPDRPARLFPPVAGGSYTIRATWDLEGCTEIPDGTDCLTPLQLLRPPSSVPNVDLQTPVEVVSNVIEVSSPVLPDLGPLKIEFKVTLARQRVGGTCASGDQASAACAVFHYAIRNLADRPIRNGRWTCSDFSIIPDYRTMGGSWSHFKNRLWVCSANALVETPIMPGKAAEGDFTLHNLAPLYDLTPLEAPGSYEVRFHFQPAACWAAPDGSFCLQWPKDQTPMVSRAFTLSTHP